MTGTILFVHGAADIGGSERDLLLIVDRLRQAKRDPAVVCPAQGPLIEALREREVKTYSVPFPAWRKLFAYPKRRGAVEALRRVLLASRPDLVHVNDFWWMPQTLEAAKGLDLPILAYVRQEIEVRKVQRYNLDRAAIVVAMSRMLQRSIEAAGVRHVRTVYSGLECREIPEGEGGQEVRRRFGIPEGAPVIGTVANLFPRKGYDVVLSGLPRILESVPKLHYVIVGSGNPEHQAVLEGRVGQLGLADRVHFAGFQRSVYPYLAAMDLYVHPARLEGFGIAVMEAMAMGKAVVASNTGGIPDIVVDGQNGVLVRPGDVAAFADSIMTLLGDDSRRVAMGQAARERIRRHFTIEAMMEQLNACYGEAVATSGSMHAAPR